MSKSIFIVSQRYGTELLEPSIFHTRNEAEDYVKKAVYDNITELVYDEIEEDGIDINNIEKVLEWAEENDYCTSYNTDVIDTSTIADDWLECKITEKILS